ncbi:putative arginine--tRNA ligase [Fasciola hepatica]|uniref:Probable arginine--tRNA ligase, mitochondrial n=1 Tax=Fasciola hepatica TaxID=6192 RepID=A0A4E0RR07_FASHE|nr:putative arginine--tRNA ligase [Fasciola hepatica]
MKNNLIKFLQYPVRASPLSLFRLGSPQTVLVDFSSPNIAKPFHLGHFRATVTGNFVRNINEAMHHRVVAINYLGDWGTQFDLLARAFHQYGSWDKLNTNPMRHLQEIYVRVNQENGTSLSAQSIPDSDRISWWARVREMTIAHLEQTYSRMNVRFTVFEYESDYVDAAKRLVDRLLVAGLAMYDSDGVVVFRTSTTTDSSLPNPRISLLKSDGSTLYLTRDIASAISRYERYHFDRIHYVVEDGQRLHFQHLCTVLQGLNCHWLNATNPVDSPADDFQPSSPSSCQIHIPFGRVQGASTRRGQGVTLSDILDGARHTILQRMAKSPNTRFSDVTDPALSNTERQAILDVADHLGVTCLVVEFLRQRRQKPVRLRSFMGNPVANTGPTDPNSGSDGGGLDTTDLSGLGLQYCHARLCSLERRAIQSGIISSDSAHSDQTDLTVLCEKIDQLDSTLWTNANQSMELKLLKFLTGFESALLAAYEDYEASVLVQFATKLTAEVNLAWKRSPVLSCDDLNIKLLRLSTFLAARNVLAVCLRLLGIRPLRRI